MLLLCIKVFLTFVIEDKVSRTARGFFCGIYQDILNEVADEGKKIYDENEIKMLQENTKVMQLWIKNNPKKAEDFLRFKDGFEAK